jgi:hypothetical protein
MKICPPSIRNQANLKGTIRTLISDMINREFPQDDIVEMMQTSLCKPNDVTPTEHYERFVQLKKCADWTNGTCSVPTDQELKTYWGDVFAHAFIPVLMRAWNFCCRMLLRVVAE